jgi:hypothetical protein
MNVLTLYSNAIQQQIQALQNPQPDSQSAQGEAPIAQNQQ